jgi:predicted DNA-binding transcriptional regulator YafY
MYPVNNKSERLLRLVNLLCSRNGITLAQLQEELEICERNVYRYINELRAAKYPIATMNKQGQTYYCIDRRFAIHNVAINDDQALALLHSLQAFDLAGFPYQEELRQVKDKVLACIAPERYPVLRDKFQVAHIDLKHIYEINAAMYKQIEQAAWDLRQLHITYQSMKHDKASTRIIDPYGLVFKQHGGYLIGYCHKRNDIRTFRLNRIVSVEVLESVFSRPAEFSLQKFFLESLNLGQGEVITVKIKLAAELAKQFQDTIYHPSQTVAQQPDGSLLCTMMVRGIWEILHWVMSFGSRAQVLEPVELRKAVAEELRWAVKVYD